METIACFVSPHGFGHAARACAVIEALSRSRPAFRFHIFTTVPRWFFAESLSGCFEYHLCCTDIGLVQVSPLEEDLEAGHVRDFLIPLEGVTVVALNVTKLRTDIVDPREYLERLEFWESEVRRGGGHWRVQNDLERLERLLEEE